MRIAPSVAAPDLSFPSFKYGARETPLSLNCLLYKGGSEVHARHFQKEADAGKLGPVRRRRIPLAVGIHETINAALVGGGARLTARTCIVTLRSFYSWMDANDREPTERLIKEHYLAWADHMHHLARTRRIKMQTAYDAVNRVANTLDRALDLTSGLVRHTTLWRHRRGKRMWESPSDRTNLQEAFSFGSLLLSLSNALTTSAVRGPVPIQVPLGDGRMHLEWLRLLPPEKRKSNVTAQTIRMNAIARARLNSDPFAECRKFAMNLRVEAEMLIFIAQTGMNLAQANRLRAGSFSYHSHLDGYQVRRVYKGRRKGEVEFEIFGEYRPYFERYLSWRKENLSDPGLDRLFPPADPRRANDIAPLFHAVRRRCAQLGIAFVGPRDLRRTRINWLRRSLRDPALTAEMAQHTEEVLFKNYDTPHYQTALVEVSKFLRKLDPFTPSAGPGACVERRPEPTSADATEVAEPDCISPAGCLFCVHHRDVDSFDYIWSLDSYRYLKTLELASCRPLARDLTHPARVVIERISRKLEAFESRSKTASKWLSEASARVKERAFHPRWEGFIRLMESLEVTWP